MYYGTNPLFLDKNRPRKVVFYGRVSTEHEAQLSALENQMQWYEDTAKRFPNWEVVGRYIDAPVIIGLKQNPTQTGAALVLFSLFTGIFETFR